MPAQTNFRRELLPQPLGFYEHELGKLSRPSRGWARGNCPFHRGQNSTSFCVNIVSGGFHCFSCGAKGGDIVAFLMLRDGLGFKTAARLLGAWLRKTVSETERRRLSEQQRERQRIRECDARNKRVKRKRRLELRHKIHVSIRIQNKISDRLGALLQGAKPRHLNEADQCWEVLAVGFDELRVMENDYMVLAGLESI